MAGAAGVSRRLHSGRRAAADPGRRVGARVRGEADGEGKRLSPGEFAGEIPDVANAGEGGAGGGVAALTLPWRGRVGSHERSEMRDRVGWRSLNPNRRP